MTADDRARVREIVERSCEQQGVALTVPPDVARAVATMIAVRGTRRRKGDHDGRPAAE